MDVLNYLQENKFQVGVVSLGVGVMLVGLVQMMDLSRGHEVEVIESEDKSEVVEVGSQENEVVVDVAGAVNMPGVYEVDEGSRVAEVLELAGGFEEKVDQLWVAKHINQAIIVTDGQKIYIPYLGEELEGGVGFEGVGSGEVVGAQMVSVNQASQGQLEDLWGIGDARAKAIISNRPYTTLEELMEKAGIPQNVMEENTDKWGL